MIYSNNNKPLVLTESDADAFLESVGVELFEDSIAIDGTLYEGTYGEEILEANGIFLYEDGIVLEGELANNVKKFGAAAAERGKKLAHKANMKVAVGAKKALKAINEPIKKHGNGKYAQNLRMRDEYKTLRKAGFGKDMAANALASGDATIIEAVNAMMTKCSVSAK